MAALLDEVDAVTGAVLSSLHKQIGLQVAEHGRVHALIERSLVANSKDSRMIAEAFKP